MVLAAATALTAANGPIPALAAPQPAPTDTAAGLARPAADDPALRGAIAPIGGVVPGLTGAAAEQAAGTAADRFRQLTRERTHRAAAKAPAAQDAQLHTSWGIRMPNGASKGLQATQSVVSGARATSGGDYVYAPTAIPAGGACMEMTTAYTPDGALLWAWDWCGGRDTVGKAVPMDAGFLATYTTTVNGHPAYSEDIHQTDSSSNTWTTYLYNYQTHAWDSFYTSSGTYDIPEYAFGWDMFEVYTSVNSSTGAGYYCQDMAGQTFESSSIQLLSGSTWTPASSSNSTPDSSTPPSGSTLDCPSLSISLTHPNDHWTAHIG